MFLAGVTIVSIFFLAITIDAWAEYKKAKIKAERQAYGNEVINKALEKVH
jgi:hypothetical protein